jgi:hypothetical protein
MANQQVMTQAGAVKPAKSTKRAAYSPTEFAAFWSRHPSWAYRLLYGGKVKAFCPKAFAGIGSLPDTITDRCVPIRLKKKRRNETVKRFRIFGWDNNDKPGVQLNQQFVITQEQLEQIRALRDT